MLSLNNKTTPLNKDDLVIIGKTLIKTDVKYLPTTLSTL